MSGDDFSPDDPARDDENSGESPEHLSQQFQFEPVSARVPERVAVLDALPYNEMGKLLRREVRDLFQS